MAFAMVLKHWDLAAVVYLNELFKPSRKFSLGKINGASKTARHFNFNQVSLFRLGIVVEVFPSEVICQMGFYDQ
jgi:hypothetical protein